eukprot:gene876-10626_t
MMKHKLLFTKKTLSMRQLNRAVRAAKVGVENHVDRSGGRRYVDYGRQNYSSVFNNSSFGDALNNGNLNIPTDDFLPNTGTRARFCFVPDKAFPLKETIQRPYPGKNLTEKLRIFNYRLYRARRVVENAFGILSGRWRFLRAPIQAQPDKAAKNVLPHNWLKKHDDSQKSSRRLYCPVRYVDYDDSHGIVHKGIWRSEVSEAGALADNTQMGSNDYPKTAEKFRTLMADVSVSPQGEIPWHYTDVRRTSYEPVH